MKPRLRSLLWGFMALTLLLAGTTLVCAYDISFSDVPESSWFYEDVMTLSESGVVSGYPDGTYRPTKKVTTGEYSDTFSLLEIMTSEEVSHGIYV